MPWPKWIEAFKRNILNRPESPSSDDRDPDRDLFDGYAGEEMVEPPVEDWIDLHHYRPRDLRPLLWEYLDLCRRKGLREVRVIHGKGGGILKKCVHDFLAGEDYVESYRLGSFGEGEWGATIVRLKILPPD